MKRRETVGGCGDKEELEKRGKKTDEFLQKVVKTFF